MNPNDSLTFEVWVEIQGEDDRPRSACVAAFRYFQEALDFTNYVTKRGLDVVVRNLEGKRISIFKAKTT